MFDWLRFIGEFLLERITGVFEVFKIAGDAFALLGSSFMVAPEFLYPVLYLMLSVAIIMWVVNIF